MATDTNVEYLLIDQNNQIVDTSFNEENLVKLSDIDQLITTLQNDLKEIENLSLIQKEKAKAKAEAEKNKMAKEWMTSGGRDPDGRSLDEEIELGKQEWLKKQKDEAVMLPAGLGNKYKSDIRSPAEHKRAEFKSKVEAKKAKAEASKNTRLTPVVVCKMNTRDPLVILDLDHFMSLIR